LIECGDNAKPPNGAHVSANMETKYYVGNWRLADATTDFLVVHSVELKNMGLCI
jgi:hypothetical protein